MACYLGITLGTLTYKLNKSVPLCQLNDVRAKINAKTGKHSIRHQNFQPLKNMTPISAIILPDTDPLIHGSGSGSVRGSPDFIGNLDNIYAVGHFRMTSDQRGPIQAACLVVLEFQINVNLLQLLLCCCFCRSKWQI